MKRKHTLARGFTLVEMAVVLVIVGLMLGGLLVPLGAQMEQRSLTETRNQLSEIREALIGFALLHGRLPCPTTQTDPSNAGYGEEDASCNGDAAAEGYLPWKTLGVAEIDAWGTKRNQTTSPWSGYWRYRVDRNFSNSAAPVTLNTGFSTDSLTVRNSAGTSLTSSSERPVAIVFSAGKNLTPDGQNADAPTSYEPTSGIYESNDIGASFDDIMIWIARPILMSRMVAAGKIP